MQVSAADSDNTLLVAQMETLAGSEPPRHLHTLEDELFLIREGHARFFVGENTIDGKPGDTIFLPRGVPHHYKILSDRLITTLVATPAAGMEGFLESLSIPVAEEETLCPDQPSEAYIQYFMSLTEQYGMRFI